MKTEVETSNVDLDWYSSGYYSYCGVLRGKAEELEFKSLTGNSLL